MYFKGNPVGKLVLQVAPTGMVPTLQDNPHLPITPDAIAEDVCRCYELGVSVAHIHARDEQGRPTPSKDIYAEIISKIRERCPGIVVCASTSGRTGATREQRAEVLDLGPEMASLTLGSVNFFNRPSLARTDDARFLAAQMPRLGVKPEIEVFEPGFINMAQYLAKKGLLDLPLHFNLMLGSLGSIPADVRDLSYLVDSLPPDSTWCAAGIGRFQTQVAAAAILMGGHVRIGLEDSIYYNCERKELATNAMLVKRVVALACELDREIASPAEARELLDLEVAEVRGGGTGESLKAA